MRIANATNFKHVCAHRKNTRNSGRVATCIRWRRAAGFTHKRGIGYCGSLEPAWMFPRTGKPVGAVQSRHSSEQTLIKADTHQSRHSSEQTLIKADTHQSRHSSEQTLIRADTH